jgi:hypothetical protein
MSGRYAAGTDVPVDRSKAELERLLVRYGATSFLYGWEGDQYQIGFKMRERMIRFRLPMPSEDDETFWTTETGRDRTAKAARTSYEQEVRRRWRALVLVIKAKLEAIESGISDFESEFLSQIMLPDGRTYGEFAKPQLAHVYATAEMPAFLPQLGDGR